MLFAKKKESKPMNPQAARYDFDFNVIPSVFARCFDLMFSLGDGDLSEAIPVGPGNLEKQTSVKVYNVHEGQICVLRFPDCDFSPSALFGIGVYKVADYETANKEGREYFAPYYALVRILDTYVIGKIYDDGNGNFMTEYYERMDNADQVQFLKWVMEKEQLSIEGAGEAPDPVRDFLSGK